MKSITRHFEGFLRANKNGILTLDYQDLKAMIAEDIYNYEDLEFEGTYNLTKELIFFRFYVSSDKLNLSEVVERSIYSDIGGDCMYNIKADCKAKVVGYSEYTITGLDCRNLKLGGHDLRSILGCYSGNYVHILIEDKV